MPIELMILLFGVAFVILVCWILLSPSDPAPLPTPSDALTAAMIAATVASSGHQSHGADCAPVDSGGLDVSSGDAGGGGGDS
jgi:hypothetical protein